MTGYELKKRVCSLLGFLETESNSTLLKNESFTNLVNQIGCDLNQEEIANLSESVSDAPRLREAYIYGAAMLFAAALGDEAKAEAYSEIYNAKRAGCLGSSDKIKDVLPTPLSGGE